MGRDKSQMHYHHKSQLVYLYEILSQICDQVFVSGRKNQKEEIPSEYLFLADGPTSRGPLEGIYQLFQTEPQLPGLVLACDLPLLQVDCLKELIQHRDPSCLATVFQNPTTELPEPLIGIWEPRAKWIIEASLNQGQLSPRQILKEHPIKMISPTNPDCLKNVNTPEESSEVFKIIQSKKKTI